MQNNITSNINPTVFSWSAIIVGTILCEELNVLEQNAIGNWIILLGDYLLTNAAQIAVLQADNQNNNQPLDNEQKMESLQKAIKKIEEELENLKSN